MDNSLIDFKRTVFRINVDGPIVDSQKIKRIFHGRYFMMRVDGPRKIKVDGPEMINKTVKIEGPILSELFCH